MQLDSTPGELQQVKHVRVGVNEGDDSGIELRTEGRSRIRGPFVRGEDGGVAGVRSRVDYNQVPPT